MRFPANKLENEMFLGPTSLGEATKTEILVRCWATTQDYTARLRPLHDADEGIGLAPSSAKTLATPQREGESPDITGIIGKPIDISGLTVEPPDMSSILGVTRGMARGLGAGLQSGTPPGPSTAPTKADKAKSKK